MRSASKLLGFLSFAIPLSTLLSACAFEDGHPWGALDMGLSAVFAPPAERLADDGRLRTSSDYGLELRNLSVEPESLSVRLDTGSSDALSFDPANPPAGYSLCHNGHCHADDGRLVDYADIEAELSGSAGGSEISLAIPEALIPLTATPRDIELEPCPDNCWVELGHLSRVTAQIHGVRIEAVVTDLRGASDSRLPDGSLHFVAEWPIELAASASIDEEIGPGESVGVTLDSSIDFPAEAFDGIDFAGIAAGADGWTPVDLSNDTAFTSSVAENIRNNNPLQVRSIRHD